MFRRFGKKRGNKMANEEHNPLEVRIDPLINRELTVDRLAREKAERELVQRQKEDNKEIHPSQVGKEYQSSGDAKFDAVAEVILAKLDSHSHQIHKQTEMIEAQGEQIDEMKEAIALMMQTYFDQIKRFSGNFAKIFEDGKPISNIELQDRADLLKETIESAEPSMFRMGDEETQAIYQRIMLGIREELEVLRENIKKDNIEELQDLGGVLGGELGKTEKDIRKEIQNSVVTIQSMATDIKNKIHDESQEVKRSVNSNSRNSYL